MFIIVQIEGKELFLEKMHVMPNEQGTAIETFPSKKAAKLLLEMWDMSDEDQKKNHIHIWRLH